MISLATKGVITPAGGGTKYRMRGYDTTLAGYVFWVSSEIDSDGSDYGGPGPLSDIVVQAMLGSAS